MTKRRAGAAAAAAVMVSMTASSWAWACSASPSINSVDPLGEASPAKAGDGFAWAGSSVQVQGSSVTPMAPVTIRWNATDGPVIGVAPATASGGFAVPATVPAAAPGIYYMVAEVKGVSVARTAFEVTGPAAEAAPAPHSLWATGPSAPAPATSSALGASSSAGVLGVGLLGGGLVVLFAGATFATLGRRRGRAVIR